MIRWLIKKGELGENPKVDAFLEDLWAVCEKHGLVLVGEGWRDFPAVEPLVDREGDRGWLFSAADNT